MKLETFFEKFDQLTDAPDAVAKLRELVTPQRRRDAENPNSPPQRLSASAGEMNRAEAQRRGENR